MLYTKRFSWEPDKPTPLILEVDNKLGELGMVTLAKSLL